MNTFGRVLVIYILVLASTGSDEVKSKYNENTTTTKWKASTTTTKEKEATTSTTSTSWRQPTTSTKWTQSTTTTKSKPPITITNWKKTTTSKWNQHTTVAPHTKITSASNNHGVVAIASISGIDSRNGRVSSMNGIKIYPSAVSSMVNTDDKGNFVFKTVNGKPMPITITKEGDGVSGTIRILPGSVSVSSSASSSKSDPSSVAASFNSWSPPFMNPLMNDLYFPPIPTFPTIPDSVYTSRIPQGYNTRLQDPFPYMRFPEPTIQSRIQDPWFVKDKYKHQMKHDAHPNWYYPTFNPFINFW